jgi:hypothetical protein
MEALSSVVKREPVPVQRPEEYVPYPQRWSYDPATNSYVEVCRSASATLPLGAMTLGAAA